MHPILGGRMGDASMIDLSASVELADVTATEALGARIGRALRAGDLVALDGPLGSGKTCLVRGIAQGMGIDPALVTSPSFILMQRYGEGPIGLVHMDAWRMRGEQELVDLGLDEIMAARRDVVAVEWPNKVAPALPTRLVRITIAIGTQDTRTARVDDQRERGGVRGD